MRRYVTERIREIVKLGDPPHKLALAFAIGIFVAFSPWIGLHIISCRNYGIAGTWTNDALPGLENIWKSVSGVASKTVIVCIGNGTVKIRDETKDSYEVKIWFANVEGTDAFIAGPVVSAINPAYVNRWVYIKMHDGGDEGSKMDHVWIDWATSEEEPKEGVAMLKNPLGPYPITSGNIRVYSY